MIFEAPGLTVEKLPISGDYLVTVHWESATLDRDQAIELYRSLLRDLIRTEKA